MKILLTNDDGIQAPGIAALHKSLKKLGAVTVVAPDSERSSISHAITLNHPIYAKKFLLGIGLSGTPSDCVKYAVDQVFKKKPDIVVSGINQGPNEGCSVIYSGTVAGAREGALLGIPSFAVSLDSFDRSEFTFAANVAVKIIKRLLKKKIDAKTFFNINVPCVAASKIKGIRFTQQCMTPIHGTFQKCTNPNSKPYFWLSGKLPLKNKNLSIDSHALHQKYVTVTPVHCDATDYEALEELQGLNISI